MSKTKEVNIYKSHAWKRNCTYDLSFSYLDVIHFPSYETYEVYIEKSIFRIIVPKTWNFYTAFSSCLSFIFLVLEFYIKNNNVLNITKYYFLLSIQKYKEINKLEKKIIYFYRKWDIEYILIRFLIRWFILFYV